MNRTALTTILIILGTVSPDYITPATSVAFAASTVTTCEMASFISSVDHERMGTRPGRPR